MEQNFQTSFIPKKPIVEEVINSPKKSMSFLTIFTIILFLTMALTFGGLYFYESVLAKNIVDMQASLKKANERFEVAKIKELQILDKRLVASGKILSKHLTISPVFQILQDITMKTVRYTEFSYDITDTDKILIKMSGEADGYRSIALQADLFSSRKELIDPVFSNLTLQEKSNVVFDLEFSVDPSLVNYKQALEKERPSAPAPSNIIPVEAGGIN